MEISQLQKLIEEYNSLAANADSKYGSSNQKDTSYNLPRDPYKKILFNDSSRSIPQIPAIGLQFQKELLNPLIIEKPSKEQQLTRQKRKRKDQIRNLTNNLQQYSSSIIRRRQLQKKMNELKMEVDNTSSLTCWQLNHAYKILEFSANIQRKINDMVIRLREGQRELKYLEQYGGICDEYLKLEIGYQKIKKKRKQLMEEIDADLISKQLIVGQKNRRNQEVVNNLMGTQKKLNKIQKKIKEQEYIIKEIKMREINSTRHSHFLSKNSIINKNQQIIQSNGEDIPINLVTTALKPSKRDVREDQYDADDRKKQRKFKELFSKMNRQQQREIFTVMEKKRAFNWQENRKIEKAGLNIRSSEAIKSSVQLPSNSTPFNKYQRILSPKITINYKYNRQYAPQNNPRFPLIEQKTLPISTSKDRLAFISSQRMKQLQKNKRIRTRSIDIKRTHLDNSTQTAQSIAIQVDQSNQIQIREEKPVQIGRGGESGIVDRYLLMRQLYEKQQQNQKKRSKDMNGKFKKKRGGIEVIKMSKMSNRKKMRIDHKGEAFQRDVEGEEKSSEGKFSIDESASNG